MTIVIDGILKEWGDKLHYPAVKGRKSRNIRGGHVCTKKDNQPVVKSSATSARSKFSRTLNKAPEVMVKISGGGKNMRHVKAHIDYISRNGKIEMEDENGDVHLGKDGIQDVRDAWAKGRVGIPLESEKRREVFNIVLSMPPGTNRQGVKDAARAFAAEQFTHHQYVFAAHDDEKHPHVHLAVKAVDKSCVRLNPRKADLQRWREHFADKLREQGIIANATPRRVRGIIRKAEKQVIRHIERRDAKSIVRVGQKADILQEIKTGKARKNPAWQKIANIRKETLKIYGEIARALSKSPDISDKKLAMEVVNFVRKFPPIKTLHEQAVESVQLQKEARKAKQNIVSEVSEQNLADQEIYKRIER